MDELANQGGDWIRSVEAAIAGLPQGAVKDEMVALAQIVHGMLSHWQARAATAGLIQPDSGGDPKPPGN